jgi:riboflavin biosynthesis pyrimidine reductase
MSVESLVGVWPGLTMPEAPADRPYTWINMVTTIDGKIITGDRNEDVHDLGSDLDHATMKQIAAPAGAVLIGAGTLRSTPGLAYRRMPLRLVATARGEVDPTHAFFTSDHAPAFVVTSQLGASRLPAGLNVLACGETETDWVAVFAALRNEMGVTHLLVEGGSELNAALLKADLIDELFMTLAPKIKLGRDIPTYADGEPLTRDAVQKYDLIAHQMVENELFLRYRRRWTA